jgi:hypothetical protein
MPSCKDGLPSQQFWKSLLAEQDIFSPYLVQPHDKYVCRKAVLSCKDMIGQGGDPIRTLPQPLADTAGSGQEGER